MNKQDQKGFTHHLVLFGIMALVLGAMGFAGYRVYKNRNIDAKAYSYRLIGSVPGVGVRACNANTDYYGTWVVRNLVGNDRTSPVKLSIRALDGTVSKTHVSSIPARRERLSITWTENQFAKKNPILTYYINDFKVGSINFSNLPIC